MRRLRILECYSARSGPVQPSHNHHSLLTTPQRQQLMLTRTAAVRVHRWQAQTLTELAEAGDPPATPMITNPHPLLMMALTVELSCTVHLSICAMEQPRMPVMFGRLVLCYTAWQRANGPLQMLSAMVSIWTLTRRLVARVIDWSEIFDFFLGLWC